MPTPDDLAVSTLGECKYQSPLPMSTVHGDGVGNFVPDSRRVLADIEIDVDGTPDLQRSFERAGPRQHLYFDAQQTTAAIVTCGGLCPGLNNVIRALYAELSHNYGVPRILGIRYGYQGLNSQVGVPPIELTAERVEEIQNIGGTILGSSRGNQEPATMADFLVEQGVSMLFCLGGDGTQRGAHALAEEIGRRGLPIAIVGIPKTIDNDIAFVDKTFGFGTAVEKALEHLAGAHSEAVGVRRGIGLVKLMGRHAGFIAASATLASGQVDLTLIPELPFHFEGPDGLYERIRRRLSERDHAVIVVAEGAGQEHLAEQGESFDASGNRRLGDIGPLLKNKIAEHFAAAGEPVKIKYFDPSYHIRSLPANTADAQLCGKLARRAAHAAMAGKTDMLIGLKHDKFIHVPLPLVARTHKQVDPESDLWIGVRAMTGQAQLGPKEL